MMYCDYHGLSIPELPKPLNTIVKHEQTTVMLPLYANQLTDEYLEYDINEYFHFTLMEYIELPQYMKKTLIQKVKELKEIKGEEERRQKEKAKQELELT